jgi:catechol 2,3-dioxygenase-like lactoylglutathione lyase family enzyme
MLSHSPLVCFTASKNPDAAKSFYRDILGLRLVEDGPFALVFDANGTMLRIQKYSDHVPLRTTSLGWDVVDIRATIAALTERGVRFERYPAMDQDECGIWNSPSGARVAWFKDPDGNTLSLTQF